MIVIDKRRHVNKPGGCLMEIVSLLMGRRMVVTGAVDPDWMWANKTDYPSCTNICVTHAIHRINDALPQADRQRLAHFIPRIMRARQTASDDRIAIRLHVWIGRSVLHLVEPHLHERCAQAINQLERTLWEDDVELDDERWEFGMNGAAHAIVTKHVHNAINAVTGTLAYDHPDELIAWLDALLDAHAKAMVEEGEALWDPTIDYPDDDEVQAVVDAILAS